MKSQQFENVYLSGLAQAQANASILISAAAELAKAAEDIELSESLHAHVNDLSRQIDRLSETSPNGMTAQADNGLSALAMQASAAIATNELGPIRDVAIIAAVQHIQHYQIATFGTLAAYAKMLGRHHEKRVLGALLEDERGLDEDLSVIATMILDPHDRAVAA
ncbi:MAG: DUF892 family protein [Alphaproteobacteria bacterium]